jgi:hypothetical protein
MAKKSYEFSQEQNRVLKRLARLMKYTVILFLSLTVVTGTFCVFTIKIDLAHGIGYILLTIIAATFGVLTNSVSYSFRRIVETTGHDIDILMKAFKMLKLVYTLQFIWLLIITLLFLAILIMSTLFGLQSISIIASR